MQRKPAPDTRQERFYANVTCIYCRCFVVVVVSSVVWKNNRIEFSGLLQSFTGGGTDCAFRMFENTNVTGQVKAFDLDFDNVIVENLHTPGTREPIGKAILRTSDVISMEFKCKNNVLI